MTEVLELETAARNAGLEDSDAPLKVCTRVYLRAVHGVGHFHFPSSNLGRVSRWPIPHDFMRTSSGSHGATRTLETTSLGADRHIFRSFSTTWTRSSSMAAPWLQVGGFLPRGASSLKRHACAAGF